jgi:hypothetical protein
MVPRLLAVGLAAAACRPSDRPAAMTPSLAAAVADSVRAFVAQVAAGISRDGPAAWRRYFTDSAFFMASEGQVVFPSSVAATAGIEELTRVVRRIELRWGDSVRVDPLVPGYAMVGAPYHEVRVDTAGHRVEETGYFTGLAEHRAAGWQFRDAHWSVLAPPPAVR